MPVPPLHVVSALLIPHMGIYPKVLQFLISVQADLGGYTFPDKALVPILMVKKYYPVMIMYPAN